MAGGTFKSYNKKRPGAYINVVGTEKTNLPVSERGILVLPLKLDFGDKVNVVNYQANFKKLYGHELSESIMFPISDGLKGAAKIIIYRLNDGGAKATSSNQNITVTAKYAGTLGNSLKVAITAKTNSKYLIETFLNNEVVDSQEVASADQVQNNDYVDFEITNLTATAGITLSGGTDSTVSNTNYTEFLNYIETQKYNTIAFKLTEQEATSLVPVIKNFVERQREELGIKVQVVVPTSSTTCDYEGIIQVDNGVKLTDGTIVNKYDITAFVGGMTAGKSVSESNTYVKYDGASEPYPRKTSEEIEEAIDEGKIVFNEDCKIETDINSLISFGNGKTKAMSKNRTIRVLDAICNDIRDTFNSKYIGKINNDEDGRNLFKSDIISYMRNLESQGAIDEFDSSTDIEVKEGDYKDDIIVNVAVETIDSMEKLYMTINLV